jgi:hypothetical protein
MRKTVSILMAILVLLTGIHLSIASHLCCGNLVAVHFSVNGQDASCNMKDESTSTLAGQFIKKHCCVNDLTTLTVDSNYSPSFAKSIDVSQKVIHILGIPLTKIVKEFAYTQYSHPILSPPGIFRTNAVELDDICVFRI